MLHTGLFEPFMFKPTQDFRDCSITPISWGGFPLIQADVFDIFRNFNRKKNSFELRCVCQKTEASDSYDGLFDIWGNTHINIICQGLEEKINATLLSAHSVWNYNQLPGNRGRGEELP